jgi:hypothetical protein
LEILSGQRREVFEVVCSFGNTNFSDRKSALGNIQCQRSTPFPSPVLDPNRGSRGHFYLLQYGDFLDRRASKGLAFFGYFFKQPRIDHNRIKPHRHIGFFSMCLCGLFLQQDVDTIRLFLGSFL